MKRYTLLYMAAVLLMCSCGQQKKPADGNAADGTGNGNAPGKTENIQHRIVPLGADFTNLISVSGANIVFTQGDYRMEVVGDSALLSYMENEIESHILTISFASERNKDISVYNNKLNVTINLSAPDLQCVSLCGSGDFTSKGLWRGDKIQMGALDRGQFHCDSIECNELEFQATGDGDADFVHVKAGRMHFANSSGCNVTADIDAGFLQCDNAGHSTMSFSGKAGKTELNETKYGKILLK